MDMFSRTKIPLISALIIFILLGVLQLHNAFYHPLDRGFDATAHIPYIRYIQEQKTLPILVESFQFYQPPLYYVLGALFPQLIFLKFFGAILYFILLFVAYITYRNVFKKNGMMFSLLGAVSIAILPVLFYLSISIGNEFFSTFLISLALSFYVMFGLKTRKRALALGILLGLALASKATALVLIGSIVLHETWNRMERIQKIWHVFLMLFATVCVGGMHYIRNTVYFNNPLAAPDQFPAYFDFRQSIVPRDFNFFTTLRGFFSMDLFQSQHYSFLAGTYFSWFYDGHNVLVPVQEFSKAGAILILMSVPIFLLVMYGFFLTVRDAKESGRIFLVYSVLLLASYIMYNFHLPYFSTVKGSFIASVVLPFGYFFLRGFERLQKYSNLAIFYFLLFSIILVKHFWILDWWY